MKKKTIKITLLPEEWLFIRKLLKYVGYNLARKNRNVDEYEDNDINKAVDLVRDICIAMRESKVCN